MTKEHNNRRRLYVGGIALSLAVVGVATLRPHGTPTDKIALTSSGGTQANPGQASAPETTLTTAPSAEPTTTGPRAPAGAAVASNTAGRPATPPTTVGLAPPSATASTTTTLLAGSTPSRPVTPAQPVPMGSLEGDAAAAFGDRYAGVSYGLSTGGPRPATVHVKVGGAVPATFEGATVASAKYSLTELQQFRATLDANQQTLQQHGVPVVGWGVDIANNAVSVFVSTLNDQVQASFTSVVGPGPYLLSQRGEAVAP